MAAGVDKHTPAVEDFFADCGPGIAPGFAANVQNFIKRHTSPTGVLTRRVACVTSGGTTVPLERNCVRFIDNFSAGTRGAMSTEQFLQVLRLCIAGCIRSRSI
jgi:phosphopantothenate-cysteine ligase